MVQVALSCLTILLAYMIAARMWGATVGIVAAALIALAVTAVALPEKVHLDSLVEVSYDALGHER